MSGALLGGIALALAVGAGALWLLRMRQVRTGEVRSLVVGANAAAALLAVAAFVAGPGLAGGVAAGLALALSGVFLALQPLSPQRRAAPRVRVGERILDFEARDDAGELFALERLHGRPFLLKFFRGHW
jgi:hypothetical protein